VTPLLRQLSGHFTRELLGHLLWDREYSPDEQRHFISMMESCGVCFKVAEGHWIAVDCLPERSAVAVREAEVWRDAVPDTTVYLRYDLLHDGIRRSLLHSIGNVAGQNAVYWRYGVCLFDARRQASIRIDCRALGAPASERCGEVIVETCGKHAIASARAIVSSITRGTRSTSQPTVQWAAENAAAMLSTEEQGEIEEQTEHRPFAGIEAVQRPLERVSDKPVIHLSYAWGGESEALADRLERRLDAHFMVRRDRSVLEVGEWISRFMAEIGRSQCVVVVLSDKYLRSSYCMRELLYLYQRSLGDKESLLRRIVPVTMPNTAIESVLERHEYARYWRQQCTAVEESGRSLGDLSQGDATRRELLLMYDFKHHVVDMLTWVHDVLMPRAGKVGDQEIADAVVELVRKTLRSQTVAGCLDGF
jgi:internalin A